MIIWLASYPRSGNTLLRTILKRCFNLDSYADEPIHVQSLIRSDNNLIGHKDLPTSWEEFYEFSKNSDQLFLVKTHLPPKDTQPYIYVVRDGRSAIKSYKKYYERYLPKHNVNLYQLIAGDDAYGDWSSHYKSWVERDSIKGMIVKFENLGNISEEFLGQIASFISYQGDISKWHNPFDTLSLLEPGFFREGNKTFTQDKEWPNLVSYFFNFFHFKLLSHLSYAQGNMPSIPSDWEVFFKWSKELIYKNKELANTCNERLDLINKISIEAERRLELIHSMSPKNK